MRDTKKRGRGRPPTGKAMPMIPLRLSEPMLAEIDALAKAEGVSRSEAIRLLLERALAATTRRKR